MAVLFAAVVSLQWRTGAFTAELSGYPDEPAHYLSGLLAHDYVIHGLASSPMKFAQAFYLKYPYIAVGHWPPFFYAVEGAWMLLFSPSRISVIMLMAFITTLMAGSTYLAIRKEFGEFLAVCCALLLVFVPLVQRYSSMVMLDTLVALLSFWAALAFSRFLETERWQDAFRFGVFASLAILTKGNACFLALVPPFSILLARRLHLFKRGSFWLPALMVVAVAAPWHLLTMHLIVPTFVYTFGFGFTASALRYYGESLFQSLGPIALALAAIGIFVRIIKPASGLIEARWAVSAALLMSICLFYCTVPAGIEARYLVAVMPPLFMFFAAGIEFLSRQLAGASGARKQLTACLVLAAGVPLLAGTSKVPRKTSYGFRETARALKSEGRFGDGMSVLVSSDTSYGEGIFISEVAMEGAMKSETILRGSKVLADDNWNGTDYKPRYVSAHSLASCLDQSTVTHIILDLSPGQRHYEHQEQLEQMMRDHPGDWKLGGEFSAGEPGRRRVQVYTWNRIGRDRSLARVLTNMNGTLDHWPLTMRLACQAPVPASMPVAAAGHSGQVPPVANIVAKPASPDKDARAQW